MGIHIVPRISRIYNYNYNYIHFYIKYDQKTLKNLYITYI